MLCCQKLQTNPRDRTSPRRGTGCLLAELEEVLGGEGAPVGVEIHLDVAHAGDDEHRHLRDLSASCLGYRTAAKQCLGENEASASAGCFWGFVKDSNQAATVQGGALGVLP